MFFMYQPKVEGQPEEIWKERKVQPKDFGASVSKVLFHCVFLFFFFVFFSQ